MDYVLYGLAAVAAIGIILLAVAIVRTFFIQEMDRGKPQSIVDQKAQAAYATGLLRLVRHKTIAVAVGVEPTAFKNMQKEMETLFPHVFATCERIALPGGSLLLRWPGSTTAAPIVLMAHQDVVPAPVDGWCCDPFKGEITDDKVIGRGSFDTKATLYASLQAVEELITEGFTPAVDIYIASSADEEVSGGGAQLAVLHLEQQGIRPVLVLDEGGAIVSGALPSLKRHLALIGVIEKGYLNLRFSAKSQGGHSSTPPKNTPIARLAKFVAKVERRYPLRAKMIPEVAAMFQTAAKGMAFPYRLLFGNLWLFKGLVTWLLPLINPYGRALFSTTIAFTMMKGSDAENVIPSEAYILCNLRTHPVQNIESTVKTLAAIARKYDVDCEILEGREATPIVNTKGRAYHYLVEQIQKTFPDVLISPYIIFGGTDARFFTGITDAALRFSPVRIDNEDLKKMHGIDECIAIEALGEAVIFYKSFISDYRP